MMLHTKYQGSRPFGFRPEDFSHFPYISLCKTCDLRGGAIFGPRACYILNIKALVLLVSDKKIF